MNSQQEQNALRDCTDSPESNAKDLKVKKEKANHPNEQFPLLRNAEYQTNRAKSIEASKVNQEVVNVDVTRGIVEKDMK